MLNNFAKKDIAMYRVDANKSQEMRSSLHFLSCRIAVLTIIAVLSMVCLPSSTALFIRHPVPNTAALHLTRRPIRMTSGESVDPSSIPIMKEKTPITTARARARAGKSWIKCKPIGVGAMAGQTVIPNESFQSLVDTSDAWISKRTGIKNRHTISEGSSLRELSITSATEALKNANVNGEDIDLVIVATSSPDDLFGDAASVALAIGATKAAAFDLTAACSGFLFAVVTASQFLQTGAYKKIVVVGADALTRFIDWSDRSTCILFGDGAGAVVLEATSSEEDSGLLGFSLHSNGEGYCNLDLKYNSNFSPLANEDKTVVDQGKYGYLRMNGAEVYKFAVNSVNIKS